MTFDRWAYWIGIIVIFGTHIYMLVYGLPESQMTAHAWLNLGAGLLIGYAWMKRNA